MEHPPSLLFAPSSVHCLLIHWIPLYSTWYRIFWKLLRVRAPRSSQNQLNWNLWEAQAWGIASEQLGLDSRLNHVKEAVGGQEQEQSPVSKLAPLLAKATSAREEELHEGRRLVPRAHTRQAFWCFTGSASHAGVDQMSLDLCKEGSPCESQVTKSGSDYSKSQVGMW